MTTDELCRAEWVEPVPDGRRMRFRRDGTGHYEREASGGAPFVHENFLFRLEGRGLQLKLAHARGWAGVEARVEANRLLLACDPYAAVIEEAAPAPLALELGRGVALPSE